MHSLKAENCVLFSGLSEDSNLVRSLSDNSERYAAAATAAKSLQLCLILCDPIDGSPPGSPVPGILQARTLEWVAMKSLDPRICWRGSRMMQKELRLTAFYVS